MAERKQNLARPTAAVLDLMLMGALLGALTGFGSHAAAQTASAIQVASGLRAAMEWGLPAQRRALSRILGILASSDQPGSADADPNRSSRFSRDYNDIGHRGAITARKRAALGTVCPGHAGCDCGDGLL